MAMLDLVSNGRAELGSGESGSIAEMGGYHIDPPLKRPMWREGLEVALRRSWRRSSDFCHAGGQQPA